MSKIYNQALQEQLRNYIADNGISQNKLAPKIGVSVTKLSQYLNSKYDNGDVSKMESQLEEFFRTQQEQEASVEKARPYGPVQGYAPTSISENVYKMIRYCQLQKGLVIIHGDAGVGKTKGAGKFEMENPTATIYIESSPAAGSLRGVLKQLARALKISDKLHNDDMADEIKAKLWDGNKLVIIDEAQHLTYKALEQITRWPDPDRLTGERHISLVLMGNSVIYHRMRGRQEAIFSQQFSRMGYRLLCETRSITLDDTKKLFTKLAEDGRKKELAFLHGICQSKWGIRGAVNVYNNAVNNEDIGYEGLYSMARTMGIGLV